MTNGLYLRPTGFFYGDAAKRVSAAGQAGLLAGGPVAFTMLEVIEGTPGHTRKDFQSFSELMASHEPATHAVLEAITGPRAPIGSLCLDRPRIIGVVNVTPDSFSLQQTLDLISEGLLEYETLTGDEIKGLLKGKSPIRDFDDDAGGAKASASAVPSTGKAKKAKSKKGDQPDTGGMEPQPS